MYTDTEMYKHAKAELDILLEHERQDNLKRTVEELEREVETFGGKTAQEFMNDSILEVIASINSPRHSGSSMDYLLNCVYDLVKFRNLTPLTLDDSEWDLVAEDEERGKIYQNKRNFSVFKDDKNGVFHTDGPEMLNIALGKDPHTGEPLEALVDESENSDEQ